MKHWIVTGGVGTGKSSMLLRLKELLAVFSPMVFSADEAVSEILLQKETLNSLRNTFGSQAADASGARRDWLRAEVLPVPEQRSKLEKLLHPPVLAMLEAARKRALTAGCNLFLAEIPLHYEIGASVSADFVIVVASSRSVQVRRMMEKRGLDEHTVQKFLQAQWPIEAKVERADAVIWNDGSLASLEAQVLTLASPLLQA